MTLTNARATLGLNCKATPISSNVSGTVQVGANNETLSFTDANIAYSVRGIFVGSGDVLSLNLASGSTSGSTAFVAGVAQVTTATAAGSVSAGGNAEVIVTSAGMTGSPITLSVAVATSDTPTMWAAKVRTALNANAVIAARFTVGTTVGTTIVLTRKPSSTYTVPGGTLNLYYANDATLNISLATGTATGITTAATSAATTAGVVSDGVKIYDAASDFEGEALPTLAKLNGFLVKSNTGTTTIEYLALNTITLSDGEILLRANDAVTIGSALVAQISATSVADISITVIGQTA